MTKDYDLNIIDQLAYETDGYRNGEWEILVYKLYLDKYNTHLPDTSNLVMTIRLTNEEVERLTLGLGEDEGGDHHEADDFFIGLEEFLETYTDIPERVANLLSALPEYEMEIYG